MPPACACSSTFLEHAPAHHVRPQQHTAAAVSTATASCRAARTRVVEANPQTHRDRGIHACIHACVRARDRGRHGRYDQDHGLVACSHTGVCWPAWPSGCIGSGLNCRCRAKSTLCCAVTDVGGGGGGGEDALTCATHECSAGPRCDMPRNAALCSAVCAIPAMTGLHMSSRRVQCCAVPWEADGQTCCFLDLGWRCRWGRPAAAGDSCSVAHGASVL